MIIKHTNEAVPVIDGLIIIDCWHPSLDQRKNYNDFYISLLSKLIHFDFKCIVNAGYNIELNTKDSSIRNALQTYYWPESKIQNLNIVQNLMKHCGGENRTSVMFQEALLDNNDSIMLLEFEDFVYHWQTVLNCRVSNWLVVGQSWKNCVHNRPMGLDVFYRNTGYPQLNFYALTDGFKTDHGPASTHEQFQQDNLPWIYIENFGYKLITRSSNHWNRSMDFYRELLREHRIALEFLREHRIAVEIHCTADVAPLIPISDDTFDVTVVHEPNAYWQFSSSKFTAEYQLDESSGQKNIKIWVFDITEPLDLKVLMNHTSPVYSSFMTQNQKVVIFENSRITNTHPIENFVK